MKIKVLLLFFLIFLSFANISSNNSKIEYETNNGKKSIIIDTDAGPDDIGALLYLLKHPNIEIKAITVSCGITYIDEGVKNIQNLLQYLGYSEIPVAGGSSTPLEVNHTFPTDWRDGSKNFFGLNLPDSSVQLLGMNATDLIESTLQLESNKVSILTLGPLTNIAQVLGNNPALKNKIADITIMGGAVNVDGNVGYEYPLIHNFKAEWNIYIDPQAADIIFSSGLDILQIPLDATNNVPQTENFKTNLETIKVTKEANILFQLLTPGLYFWDHLAAVALTNQDVLTLAFHHIEVETLVADELGATLSNTTKPVNMLVAVDANRTLFEDILIKTINSGSDVSTSIDLQIFLITIVSLVLIKRYYYKRNF